MHQVRLIGRASGLAAAACLTAPAPAQPAQANEPIIVIGQRNSAGLRADSEIDPLAIDSYGFDTIGELLAEIARQTDSTGEAPVILIDGQPSSGIDEVADLPTEALAKLQTLSRDAAATLGQRPTRRVINLVLRPRHRQLTLGAKGRIATAGEGGQGEATANGLKLDQGNRNSIAVRLSATERLDESDRGIVSAPADLAANRFKSLVAGGLVASANGNLTRKIGRSSLSFTLRGEHRESDSRLGGLASDPTRRLEQQGEASSINASAVANGPLGKWRYSINANAGWSLAHTDSDRPLGIDPGDPPTPDPVFRARSRTRSFNAGLSGTLTGAPFTLPAGKANAAIRLDWRGLRAVSTRDEPTIRTRRHIPRDDLAGQLTLQLPLLADSPLGDLGAELSGALRQITDSGRTHDLGAALNWRPSDRFSLRLSIDREQSAPSAASLTDPIVTVDNVRVYDFIRQETVLVRYVTGGNRDLDVERRRIFVAGASWRPIKANLNLSLDYTDLAERGGSSSLPPVTAEVEAAFPDRFQRDPSGRLIAVDARPVSFGRARRQELRSGASFFHSFGGQAAPTSDNDDLPAPAPATPASGTRINAFVNHQWVFRSDRQLRPGLPLADLLDGGAIGEGGGEPRHRLNFGGGLVRGGIGLHLDGRWTGPSTIAAGTIGAPETLRFRAQTLFGARLFANLGTVIPGNAWAKGLRITLAAENLFDAKRRVRDSTGETPLRYQPYLLDPLGRTLSLSLRKVL